MQDIYVFVDFSCSLLNLVALLAKVKPKKLLTGWISYK